MSKSASPSSSRKTDCTRCAGHELRSLNNILHMTEEEYAHALLGGRVGFFNQHMPHTLPLNGDSRWIHIIKEEENADARDPE